MDFIKLTLQIKDTAAIINEKFCNIEKKYKNKKDGKIADDDSEDNGNEEKVDGDKHYHIIY